jgi:CheY-like chemotaxis protein
MSHEIRTSLNAVIGLSEIELQVLQAGSLPDSTRDNISRIHQSGTSLLGMINDILDISKIEANRFELAPVVYETAPLLSDTVGLNRVRIGDKPITLKLDINSDFPAKLKGDELRVRQILNNLLSNAIKYTQEGTVTLSVLCETIPDDAVNVLVRFIVRDTGIGIRAEDMGKLFTSYTQLERQPSLTTGNRSGEGSPLDTGTNRKIEGTGLGLTITKRLVEMMGGSISVESKYGKGSVFTARIMQDIEDTSTLDEETAVALRDFRYAPERKETTITRLWLPDCKALIVDDILDNLHVARGLLAPYGLQIDTAISGHEAVEKAQNGNYDIIFMDHMMPGMDGIEAAAAIRKSGISGKQTPIVALTANASHGMKELYLEKGFQDYLSKPINPELLDEIINKWLKTNNDDSSRPNPYFLEIEARRLDKLNHYRTAFEMSETAAELEFDAVYYRRFTILVESFNHLSDDLQTGRNLLIEAGWRHDAHTIRETLPAFCENIAAMWQKNANNGKMENEVIHEILQRLKKAIQDGDTITAGKTVRELGTKNLNPMERELYFKLYDLLMDDDTEKALEVIGHFEVG